MSLAMPAPNGTTTVTLRDGHSCAAAGANAIASSSGHAEHGVANLHGFHR